MKSFVLYIRSHAICQLKILKERVVSTNSPNEVCSPSLGVKTPDTDEIDDDFYENDQLGGSMVRFVTETYVICFFLDFFLVKLLLFFRMQVTSP